MTGDSSVPSSVAACTAEGADCGTISDGCGGTLNCGDTCTPPNTCGRGGTPNTCGAICTCTCTAPGGTVCASPSDVVDDCTSSNCASVCDTLCANLITVRTCPTGSTSAAATCVACVTDNDCLDQSTVCVSNTCVPCLGFGVACDQAGRPHAGPGVLHARAVSRRRRTSRTRSACPSRLPR